MSNGEIPENQEKQFFISNANKDEEKALHDEQKIPTKSSEKSGRIIWRIVNVSMTTFFIMAAGVQFNDPDPYLWVPLYGTAAILTAVIAWRPEITGNNWWRYAYLIHVFYSVGMFIYVLVELFIAVSNPASDGTLNPLTYEEGRELAGIMITSVWLFACQQLRTIRCRVPECCEHLASRQNNGFIPVETGLSFSSSRSEVLLTSSA